MLGNAGSVPHGAGDIEEGSAEAVVEDIGVPLLLLGQRVGEDDWFNPVPASSSVILRRSIEAIVVTIGSRVSVALRPIMVTVVKSLLSCTAWNG